jgi:hypothetical protein
VYLTIKLSSSPGRAKNFHFSISPKRLWGPPSLRSNWYRELFLGGKPPGREANHSAPTSAEVKKTWIYSPPPPRLHGVVLSCCFFFLIWVEVEPSQLLLRPILVYCTSPERWMKMSVEQSVECLGRETEYSGKTYPSADLSNTHATWPD